MTVWVRVKDLSTGHEYTLGAQTVRPGKHRVIDNKPAADRYGRPLPAKHNRRLFTPHKAADRAAESEESA